MMHQLNDLYRQQIQLNQVNQYHAINQNLVQITQLRENQVNAQQKPLNEVVARFRTRLCENYEQHDRSKCFNYHSEDERRRPVYNQGRIIYSDQLCSDPRNCLAGQDCKYSHNLKEQEFHPKNYKNFPCQMGQNCKLEPTLCPYYHVIGEQKGQYLHQQHENVFQRRNFFENYNNQKSRTNNGTTISMNGGHTLTSVDFESFKTQPCPYQESNPTHQKNHCPYYHNNSDRRRDLRKFRYRHDQCPEDNCPNGDSCPLAHNKVEQIYHPNRFRTKFCKNHKEETTDRCQYEKYCCYAHNDQEIKIELIEKYEKNPSFYVYKYKTVWCPYTEGHDRQNCVYAHNLQDFRRDPKLVRPQKCDKWDFKSTIQQIEQGNCPKNMECEFCHGWKELDYHPEKYKTSPCPQLENCTKPDCSGYHGEEDMAKNLKIIDIYQVSVENEKQGMPLNMTRGLRHNHNSSNFGFPLRAVNDNINGISLAMKEQQNQIQQHLNISSAKSSNEKVPSQCDHNTSKFQSRETSIESSQSQTTQVNKIKSRKKMNLEAERFNNPQEVMQNSKKRYSSAPHSPKKSTQFVTQEVITLFATKLTQLLNNKKKSEYLKVIIQKSKLTQDELVNLLKTASNKIEDLTGTQKQSIMEVSKLLEDEDEFQELTNCIEENIKQTEQSGRWDDTLQDNFNDAFQESNKEQDSFEAKFKNVNISADINSGSNNETNLPN